MKRKTIQEILEELKNQDKKVSPGDLSINNIQARLDIKVLPLLTEPSRIFTNPNSLFSTAFIKSSCLAEYLYIL